ncbi:lytic polysaccharide monooxygenase [Streptomyces thinghirensis]|nr:lytic polysaccharide monooxygenase [Streptomyces thinghirensis]
MCQNGTVSGCGAIQWEPQSVEGPRASRRADRPTGGYVPRTTPRSPPLDSPKAPGGQAWPATKVNGGQSYNFRWQFTARHATTDFRYYVTKQGWNQNHNLARSDLNLTPFFTVPYGGKQPPATLSHSGTLPSGLSGRHVIVAVWTVADTANAFYACSDVTF